jgi:hypothetical protein
MINVFILVVLHYSFFPQGNFGIFYCCYSGSHNVHEVLTHLSGSVTSVLIKILASLN